MRRAPERRQSLHTENLGPLIFISVTWDPGPVPAPYIHRLGIYTTAVRIDPILHTWPFYYLDACIVSWFACHAVLLCSLATNGIDCVRIVGARWWYLYSSMYGR